MLGVDMVKVGTGRHVGVMGVKGMALVLLLAEKVGRGALPLVE